MYVCVSVLSSFSIIKSLFFHLVSESVHVTLSFTVVHLKIATKVVVWTPSNVIVD